MTFKRTNEFGGEEFSDGECWFDERNVCNHCREQCEADGRPYRWADERNSFGCYAARYCDACWPMSGYRDAVDPDARWSPEDAGEVMYEDEY